ncbi:hypothetical protein BDV11DRAFT_207794 [Aspergillus similis]
MTRYTDDLSSCDIIGDGDVYGIGVRLGYYFSWISGLIAVVFDNPRAVRDTRRGVIMISLAVYIIMVRNTLSGSFALLEWSIVFPMAIWAPLLVLSVTSFIDQDDAPGAISLTTYIFRGHNGNDGGERPAAGDGQMDIPSRYSVTLIRFIFLAPAGISNIVFAEKILTGNNIDLSDAPLLSSGQLIPFIVGLAGLVSTLWSVTVGERLALAHNR